MNSIGDFKVYITCVADGVYAEAAELSEEMCHLARDARASIRDFTTRTVLRALIFANDVRGVATQVAGRITLKSREIYQASSEAIQHALQSVGHFFGRVSLAFQAIVEPISSSCRNAVNTVRQKTINTAQAIKNFVLRHIVGLFFAACCSIGMVLAPTQFFVGLVVTVFVRVGLHYYLKDLSQEYLKDEKNPFNTHPKYGPNYITPMVLTAALMGAVDTLAITLFYHPAFWPVAILGGIAAGTFAAEVGLDVAYDMSQIN